MTQPLNPIAFTLGPLQVRWYGIFIASAVLIALWLCIREAPQHQIDPENFYDLILYALPLSLIGARLYYVAFEWNYYSLHPDQIIAIWQGGIAIYGGLITAGLVTYFFCRKRHLPIWLMLDIMAPTVILGQAIGRWGNFMNQEAHGQITTLAFLEHLHLPAFIIQQMNIQGFYRQPTFLYESLWDLTGFILLMALRHTPHLFKQGEICLSYIIWYALGRFFTESMRTDSLWWGDFRVSQVLSVILIVGAIFLIWKRRCDGKHLSWYLSSSGNKI